MEIGPDTIVSRRGRPYVEETDQGLVLEPEPRRYVRLNGTAAVLWRALGRPAAVRELAARLVGEFGIEEERALSDAAAFVQALRARGLLDAATPPSGRAGPARGSGELPRLEGEATG